jgi:ectoine hydroxylase-related dioxygenase (phytanoyl-CoA dioxygenase family)
MAKQIERTNYSMTAQQEELQRLGHLVLRGVLTPEEVAAYRPILQEYIKDVQANAAAGALDAAPFVEREAKAKVTQTPASGSDTKPAYSLQNAPQKVAEFICSPRLGEIAAHFLGVEAVRVLHFCGFFKASGGQPTPWHQDLTYIPLDTDKVISIWLPLTDITPEMGTLIFAEGSHLYGQAAATAARNRFPVAHTGAMRAGDVSLHYGWTLHGALKNSSARMREAFAICYYADGARIQTSEGAPFMESLIESCFPGLSAGDLAIGPLNPVVFRRPSD